jgi:cAMP phosphodiesterase
MDFKVGGCFGGVAPGYNSVGFLLNDSVLLEGGTATSVFSPEELKAVTDIVISHIHLDHTKEIFFLLDNLAQMKAEAVTLNGLQEVVEGARKHLFNEEVWPDFSMLPTEEEPVLRFRVLPEGGFSTIGEFQMCPIRVNHPVPASGFIIREEGAAIVYTGDTGPTQGIWEAARAETNLKAVFAEASFPNSMEQLALESGHLTPALLEKEIALLGRPEVPVYVFHMKPLFLDQIEADLAALKGCQAQILEQGKTYVF